MPTPQEDLLQLSQRLLGDDAALVTCVRLVQMETAQGWVTTRAEESRVWERRDSRWWHVHFHRSDNGRT